MSTYGLYGALGATTTLISAVSIAGNINTLSAAYNNVQGGGGGGGSKYARIKVTQNYTTLPTQNTATAIWFIKSDDGGSTYEAGDSTTPYTPVRLPDMLIPVPSTVTNTTPQPLARDVPIPAGFFKILARNDNTGQTCILTVALTPYAEQNV